MPGFVGLIENNLRQETLGNALGNLSGEQLYSVFSEGFGFGFKSIRAGVGDDKYEDERILVQVFGYLTVGDLPAKTISQHLAERYADDELFECLEQLNGYFSLLIFDKSLNKIHLVSDRYATMPLYLWMDGDRLLGFSSELKGVSLNPSFELDFDKEAIQTYLNVGHFLANRTWFKSIVRMEPSTHISVDLTTDKMEKSRYWTWSTLSKRNDISFDEAVETTGRLFKASIGRCLSAVTQDNLSITLSGGLDSRALLAAAVDDYHGEIQSFTFGKNGCDDAVIAAKVSDVAKVNNHFREIESDNWFEGREHGAWLTDGMQNVLHMHTLNSVPAIQAHSNFLLNGYIGDLVLGGSYLLEGKNDVKVSMADLEAAYGDSASDADLDNEFFDFSSTDPIFIQNRCSRFVSLGSDLLSHDLLSLKPFCDVELLDYVYALPDEYRRNGKLYHSMLLKFYPNFFAEIPWQDTGKPITGKDPVVQQSDQLSWKARLRRHLVRVIKGSVFETGARWLHRRFGSGNKSYVDYNFWLRDAKFESWTKSLLTDKNAVLQSVIGKENIDTLLSGFYQKRTVHAESIGSLISAELYFRKLMERKQNAPH